MDGLSSSHVDSLRSHEKLVDREVNLTVDPHPLVHPCLACEWGWWGWTTPSSDVCISTSGDRPRSGGKDCEDIGVCT